MKKPTLTNVLIKPFVQFPIEELVEVFSPVLYFGKKKSDERGFPLSFKEENYSHAVDLHAELMERCIGLTQEEISPIATELYRKYKPFSTRP